MDFNTNDHSLPKGETDSVNDWLVGVPAEEFDWDHHQIDRDLTKLWGEL